MPILEFYGAGGLKINKNFTDALKRYKEIKLKPLNKWKFRATNLDQTVSNSKREDSIDQERIVLSIPVYYLGIGNEDFYSFDKIMGDTKSFPEDLNKIFELAKGRERILQKLDNLNIQESYKYKLEVLNIQSGNGDYWAEKINNINNDTFYIFYWSIASHDKEKYKSNPESLKKIKQEYEIRDEVWGYSKFMRDFLKTRNLSVEWEINEIKDLSEELLKELIHKEIEKRESDTLNKDIEKQIEFLSGKASEILNKYHQAKKKTKRIGFVDLSKLYLYSRSNHFDIDYFDKKLDLIGTEAYSAHLWLRDKDSLLLNPNAVEKLGSLENKLFFYDLFKNVTDACINYRKLSKNFTPDFIFLDDIDFSTLDSSVNADKAYLEKFKQLHKWFPRSRFAYSTDRNFLDYYFKIKESPEEIIFKNLNFSTDTLSPPLHIENFNDESEKPLFIGIDIDWNGEEYGLELLKKFRENVHKIKRPCFIFVFSRYEYPSTVRKALASGALFYVSKQNYMNLVPRVYQIMRMLKDNPREIIEPKYLSYENWHLLSKLEPAQIVQLKTQLINGFELGDVRDEIFKKRHEWKWIRKLPKADLHCHIGSCIGPDFMPITALTVLSELYPPDSFDGEKIKCIVEFVSLFVRGLKVIKTSDKEDKVVLKSDELYETFGVEDKNVCIFEWITKVLDLEKKKVFPEEALLNPNFSDMSLAFYGSGQKEAYFRLRQKLKEMNVRYDIIMLFFIIMVYLKEEKILDRRNLKIKIKKILKKLFNCNNNPKTIDVLYKEHFLENIDKNQKSQVDKFINNLFQVISVLLTKNKTLKDFLVFDDNSNEILRNLQTATKSDSGSLFNYLRGCEYGGSPHLQTKTSIYLTCYYIVHHYAIPDNIQYLTLRCAVDGYKKFGLIKSNEEAMEALLKGLDYAVKKANAIDKKIHVDVILTAKRHKSSDEFSQNADLALKYRNGLLEANQATRFIDELYKEKDSFSDINSKWKLTKSLNKKIDKHFSTLDKSHDNTAQSFFETQTKVVSFDLAGLEEGNRASKYYDLFLPLLKKCFPITIHAGEEDTYEAIWEAIYEVQSQRIGHALTLRNSPELLALVIDRHIAVELCPVSNILTRKKTWKELPPEDRNNKEEYKKEVYYPLRQYLMENIDVTINTDNPYVSGTTLTDEFMVASKMAGGLTKWEILRLIKNSFRSAALPKEQKKRLMNEIDDEIYNLLLYED